MNATEIANLIVQLGPLGLQLFLALEQRMNLTSDEKTNIANAIAASNQADADTISNVSIWMKANGFKTTFVSDPVAPAVSAPTKA